MNIQIEKGAIWCCYNGYEIIKKKRKEFALNGWTLFYAEYLIFSSGSIGFKYTYLKQKK